MQKEKEMDNVITIYLKCTSFTSQQVNLFAQQISQNPAFDFCVSEFSLHAFCHQTENKFDQQYHLCPLSFLISITKNFFMWVETQAQLQLHVRKRKQERLSKQNKIKEKCSKQNKTKEKGIIQGAQNSKLKLPNIHVVVHDLLFSSISFLFYLCIQKKLWIPVNWFWSDLGQVYNILESNTKRSLANRLRLLQKRVKKTIKRFFEIRDEGNLSYLLESASSNLSKEEKQWFLKKENMKKVQLFVLQKHKKWCSLLFLAMNDNAKSSTDTVSLKCLQHAIRDQQEVTDLNIMLPFLQKKMKRQKNEKRKQDSDKKKTNKDAEHGKYFGKHWMTYVFSGCLEMKSGSFETISWQCLSFQTANYYVEANWNGHDNCLIVEKGFVLQKFFENPNFKLASRFLYWNSVFLERGGKQQENQNQNQNQTKKNANNKFVDRFSPLLPIVKLKQFTKMLNQSLIFSLQVNGAEEFPEFLMSAESIQLQKTKKSAQIEAEEPLQQALSPRLHFSFSGSSSSFSSGSFSSSSYSSTSFSFSNLKNFELSRQSDKSDFGLADENEAKRIPLPLIPSLDCFSREKKEVFASKIGVNIDKDLHLQKENEFSKEKEETSEDAVRDFFLSPVSPLSTFSFPFSPQSPLPPLSPILPVSPSAFLLSPVSPLSQDGNPWSFNPNPASSSSISYQVNDLNTIASTNKTKKQVKQIENKDVKVKQKGDSLVFAEKEKKILKKLKRKSEPKDKKENFILFADPLLAFFGSKFCYFTGNGRGQEVFAFLSETPPLLDLEVDEKEQFFSWKINFDLNLLGQWEHLLKGTTMPSPGQASNKLSTLELFSFCLPFRSKNNLCPQFVYELSEAHLKSLTLWVLLFWFAQPLGQQQEALGSAVLLAFSEKFENCQQEEKELNPHKKQKNFNSLFKEKKGKEKKKRKRQSQSQSQSHPSDAKTLIRETNKEDLKNAPERNWYLVPMWCSPGCDSEKCCSFSSPTLSSSNSKFLQVLKAELVLHELKAFLLQKEVKMLPLRIFYSVHLKNLNERLSTSKILQKWHQAPFQFTQEVSQECRKSSFACLFLKKQTLVQNWLQIFYSK